jgi:hypothetical protein
MESGEHPLWRCPHGNYDPRGAGACHQVYCASGEHVRYPRVIPGQLASRPVTSLQRLRIDISPVFFKKDSVSNPAGGIAVLLAVIPVVGWLLAALVAVPVHLLRSRKQKKVNDAIHTGNVARPWNWRILTSGPDPDGDWTEMWVSGDWITQLGLEAGPTGFAWVKGMEHTREGAEEKARRAHDYLSNHLG